MRIPLGVSPRPAAATFVSMSKAADWRLRLTPAGRYWFVTACGFILIAILKNINLLMIIGYILLTLLFVNAWQAWRGLPRCRFRVAWPDSGTAGRPFQIQVLPIDNSHLFIRGAVAEIALGDGPTVRKAIASSGDRPTRIGMTLARGVYPDPMIVVRQSYPFGLFEVSKSIGGEGEFWVSPDPGKVDLDRILRVFQSRMLAHGQKRTTVRTLIDGSDVHGLRPFRIGDSPRWIHWRTTARVSRLMVREFDRSSGVGLRAVADPGRGNCEPTLSYLAGLATEWSRTQDGALEIVVRSGDTWLRYPLAHRRGLATVLKALAQWPHCDPHVPTGGEIGDESRIALLLIGPVDYPAPPRTPVLRIRGDRYLSAVGLQEVAHG
ncbi:MAG: DUF58 domain-containing protein [Gemmataceae bacterium]|nr:DUF58 domain-containing protein [Gemmataceae bacterium]